MRTSDQIDQIAAALCKFQAEVIHPKRDKQVDTGKFKYKYSSMPAIIESIREPLADNGLCVTQILDDPGSDKPYVHLVTRLMHVSGQYFEGCYPIMLHDSPQAMGSACTYARRYSLSILGIIADDDDDAVTAEDEVKDRETTVQETVSILMREQAELVRQWVPSGTSRQEVKQKLVDICRMKAQKDQLNTGELLKVVEDTIRSAIASRME